MKGSTLYLDANLPQVSLKDVPGIAMWAEDLGFDALWTSETRHDPFLPCTLIAEHTSRLRFGTAIAVSFARSPATIAYLAWDLAAQSHGRFILGLGTQVRAHIERRFGMPWPQSVTHKLGEQIRAIHALWDCWQQGTKLNFRGQYHRLTLMSPFFNPGPIAEPHVPIYIAGVNAGLARLAGELCEGFVVHPFHSPRYLQDVILPALGQGAGKAGRERDQIAVSVTAFVAASPSAREQARAQIAFYASTPSYRPVMALHGWGHVAEQLSAHAARGEWDRLPGLITDEMLEQFCLVSNASELADSLQARYRGLAARLSVYEPVVPGERDDFWRGLTQALG